MTKEMQEKISIASENILGLMMAMMSLCHTFGEELMTKFLGKVPERGEALWLRFKKFQRERSTAGLEVGFEHFFAHVLCDGKVPQLEAQHLR